jgi:hypothetical protein
MPGGILGHPVPGGCTTADLAHQVGGVSDETVIYGCGSCATLTCWWLHCKLQTRPLVIEGALEEEETVTQKKIWNLVICPIDIKT